jgi:hypothetical protein
MLDSATVDQIVANVLKQLSTGGSGMSSGSGSTAVVAATPTAPRGTADSRLPLAKDSVVVTLSERIITGDLLAEKATGASQIIIPVKAILTPTAHDFLKTSRVQVVRGSGTAATKSGEATSSTWKWITVTSTPAVARLSGELGAGWSCEVLGCPDDAASLAISAICRGEASFVVIVSKQHFRAACRANRNEKVRAAPVSSPAEVKAAREQLRLNVIAIDPTSRSYFELKNILGAFTAPAQ